jgi:hypothetical protein
VPERIYIDRRLAQGLCGSCGRAPLLRPHTKCAGCLAQTRASNDQRRAFAAEHGLCEACTQRPRATGRGGRCTECADRFQAHARIRAARAAEQAAAQLE